ncbi:MAG: hypothetical protein ACFKPT_29815 [Gloeotrichia echinulata GP01]
MVGIITLNFFLFPSLPSLPSPPSFTTSQNRVAPAKTFLEEGYDVTVFEKKLGLGGVWEKSRSYPELTSQSTADTYGFCDYPMPKSYPDWPSAEQIRNYLESYACSYFRYGFSSTNTLFVRKIPADVD